VAIFGTVVTHHLTLELPRQLPLLPGMQQQSIDLSQAQSQAMNPDAVRLRVDAALAERYRVVERAYRGEPAATQEVMADPRMLEQVKAPLRNGGIKAQVHRELQQRADRVESELRAGDEGRMRVLADEGLSLQLRLQLAALPGRALRDPEALTRVAELVREQIMAQQQARVMATTERTLQMIQAGLQGQGRQLVTQMQGGIKKAFSAAITSMLGYALWIVALGVLIILFIPELPLRSHEAQADAVKT
jgi:hypothetical protein